MDEYLQYYLQILDSDPPLPAIMLGHTPIAAIIDGIALDLWGGRLAEPIFGILYAGAIVAWFGAARVFGPRVALAVAIILLADPAYGALYHEVSSDAVFAAAFAGWALLVVRAVVRSSIQSLAAVGVGVAMLALVRPGNQVLVVVGLLPLVLAGSLRTRIGRAAVVSLAVILPLAAWALVNDLRYGEFTVARGGNTALFHHSYVVDGDVEPTNGPATRKLIRAMRERLLTRDPYKAYGVTLDEALSAKSLRVSADIGYLAYQVWGWDGGPSVISAAGREAVLAHPATYAKNVLNTLWRESSEPYYRDIPTEAATTAGTSKKTQPEGSCTVVIKGQPLPRPTEGDVIPGGQHSWIERPDGGIRIVWTSPTTSRFVFATPELSRKFWQVADDLARIAAFPQRSSNSVVATRLNQLERRFPQPAHWLALGVLVLVIRRPSRSLALIAPASAGALVALVTAMATPPDPRYVLPMAPAVVLLAVGAVLAPRRNARPDSVTGPGLGTSEAG